MGYPLHGQDISLDVTPNQARLGWAVGWGKESFWGKGALVAEKEQGPRRRLFALESTGRAIPRPHMSVSLTPDVLLGEITSGTFSPTLKKGIALALLSTVVDPEAQVGVDVRGRREMFQIVKAALRRHLGARVMNLPDQPQTFRKATASERPWAWRLEDAAGSEVTVTGDLADQRFSAQADAESWVGETWADLAAAGVDQVTLFEHERQVYGPMSLHA